MSKSVKIFTTCICAACLLAGTSIFAIYSCGTPEVVNAECALFNIDEGAWYTCKDSSKACNISTASGPVHCQGNLIVEVIPPAVVTGKSTQYPV